MAIIYHCRHCGNKVGEISQSFVDTSRLGLDSLSLEERHKVVRSEENGDISIVSICESCQEALNSRPEYHELDFFIQ